MKNEIKVKNIIVKCGADSLTPLAVVYLLYIILHGHLSPGGGFQGGVLMVAVVAFLYLGYGYKTTMKTLNMGLMHKAEGLASIFYVLFALLGVAYLGNFCQNVLSDVGNIGELLSSGTVFLMNTAVGAKVLTGVGVLALSMFGLVFAESEEKE